MKRAQLIAEAVAVVCPHCGECQPNADGCEMWTSEDFLRISGSSPCVSCEQRIIIASDTKVQFS